MTSTLNQAISQLRLIHEGEEKVRWDDEDFLSRLLWKFDVVAGHEAGAYEVQVPEGEQREAMSSVLKHTFDGLVIGAESVVETGTGVLVRVDPESEQAVLFENFRMD